jgi:hypothetical protein
VEATEYQLGGRKSKRTVQLFLPQNQKRDFSLTAIISDQYVDYDTVITYETVQIHQITSPNVDYFLHKLKFTNLLVVN